MKYIKFTFSVLLVVIASVAFAEPDRFRSGGLASVQADGSILLRAESLSVVFENYKERPARGEGKVHIASEDGPYFEFFNALFEKYIISEPEQILTLIDRQIIYGRGVTCIRMAARGRSPHSGDNTAPHSTDRYRCQFIMDVHNGTTEANPVIETRGRIGVTNGGQN